MIPRYVVLTGAGLVGAATATVSSIALFELAEHCAIPPPFSAALPVAVDVAGAIGALVWISESGPARRWGRGMAVAALALTVLGNAAAHAIAADLIKVNLGLVVAVGGTIPMSLWATVHLVALLASTTSPAARGVRRSRRPGSPDPAPQRKRPRPETARDEGASPLAEAMVATASGLAEIALQAKLAERVAGWLAEHRGKTGQPETIAQETEAAQARFPGVSAMTIRRARKILDQRAAG